MRTDIWAKLLRRNIWAFFAAVGFAAAVKGINFVLMLWLLVERPSMNAVRPAYAACCCDRFNDRGVRQRVSCMPSAARKLYGHIEGGQYIAGYFDIRSKL